MVGSRKEGLFRNLSILVGLGLVLYFASKDSQADFLVFRTAAEAVLNGHSPYVPIVSKAVYSGSAFVYPYYVAWIFTPFAFLSATASEHVYVVVSYFAYVLGMQILGIRRIPALAALMFSSVLLVSLQMGTLNPLLFLLLALAWRYRQRPIVAGLTLGLAVTAKLFLFPILLFPLFSRRYRLFGTTVVSSTFLLFAGWSFGPLGLKQYLAMLSRLAVHEGPSGLSLASLLFRIGSNSIVAQLSAAIFSIGLLASASALPLIRRRIPENSIFAALVAIALALTPILWSSYLPLLVIALAISGVPDAVLAGFGLASWLLLTPDRAGLFGDALGLGLVLISAVVILRSGTTKWRWPQPADAKAAIRGAVQAVVGKDNPIAEGALVVAAILLLVSVAAELQNVGAALTQLLVALVVFTAVSGSKHASPELLGSGDGDRT